jgi:hypothetical protein
MRSSSSVFHVDKTNHVFDHVVAVRVWRLARAVEKAVARVPGDSNVWRPNVFDQLSELDSRGNVSARFVLDAQVNSFSFDDGDRLAELLDNSVPRLLEGWRFLPPESETANVVRAEGPGEANAAPQNVYVLLALFVRIQLTFEERRGDAVTLQAGIIEGVANSCGEGVIESLRRLVPDGADFETVQLELPGEGDGPYQILGDLVGKHAKLYHLVLHLNDNAEMVNSDSFLLR